ncbi:hypothetical protein NQ314_012043 [Rhamnusium bicolor]|uniref:HTH psq-type domain-containing protein n=1 Tax=Rhamnusium bicolor TaxID=1586634 RepID=A0AAV8XEN0_9CUCU|nr:hypothetical protein NQ314_012043 [Rhamnusium bicolor]
MRKGQQRRVIKMPRKHKRLLESRSYRNYSKEKLEEALGKVIDGTLSIREASRQFSIPFGTLYNRYKGIHGNNPSHPTIFTHVEEVAILKSAAKCADWDFPLSLMDIRMMAKYYLDRRGRTWHLFKNNLPGIDWTYSLLQRHKKSYGQRISTNIKRARASVSRDASEREYNYETIKLPILEFEIKPTSLRMMIRYKRKTSAQETIPIINGNIALEQVLSQLESIAGDCKIEKLRLSLADDIFKNNLCHLLHLDKTLYDEYKLITIGTIRKNKRELPLEFVKPITRPPHTSMFAFKGEAILVSYIPKKNNNKNVLLLSTMHHTDDIDEESENLGKPVIITAYNSTKGGVDVADRLFANYNCARATNRWPLVVFYGLMNIAGINSQIIYNSNNDSKLPRRMFLESLAFELVQPHLKRRSDLLSLPRQIKQRKRIYFI